MRDHHRRAMEKAKDRLIQQNPGLLAILLGGSIAKGIERDQSDVDLIVVTPDEDYAQRLRENRMGFVWRDVADYQDGYVEGRFLSRSFIREAALRGSEPTRHSFTGAYPIYCVDPDVAAWAPRIPVYPEETRALKIAAFYTQMQLHRWYFWGEGKRMNDAYLLHRAASEIVLFGCRMILAHNRMLFPCHKRLMEEIRKAPLKPDQLEAKANRVLTELTDEAREDFCKAVEGFADWGKPDMLSRFLQDVEMSWFTQSHAVAEW